MSWAGHVSAVLICDFGNVPLVILEVGSAGILSGEANVPLVILVAARSGISLAIKLSCELAICPRSCPVGMSGMNDSGKVDPLVICDVVSSGMRPTSN